MIAHHQPAPAPRSLAERARWFVQVRSPVTLTLLGHAALGFALFATDGNRNLAALVLVVLAIAAWTKGLAGAIAGAAPAPAEEVDRVAWLIALGSVIVALIRLPGDHVRGSVGVYAVYYLLSIAALALVVSFAPDVYAGARRKRSFLIARRAALFIIALLLGAWMIEASPSPLTDVFEEHQKIAAAMLDGKSIYEPGVIHVIDTYRHTDVIPSYLYPPLSAYLSAAAFAVARDIRWAMLVGQLLGAALLWQVARRCAGGVTTKNVSDDPLPRAGIAPTVLADLFAVALLFYPRGLMILEKAWTESLALPFLGAFVLLAIAGRPLAASVCLGLLCATKQHLALYVPFLMLVPGVGLTGVLVAGAVAVATLAEYLVRGPLDMYHAIFGGIARSPFRIDALAIPSELYLLGITIPTWVGFVAALVPLAWRARVPRQVGPLLLASCLIFGLFYVWGRQAAINYYYLLDATALFAAAALGVPRRASPRE